MVVASVEMQRAEKKPTSTSTVTQQIVYVQNPSPVGMMQPGQSVQPIIYQQGPQVLYPQQQGINRYIDI